MQAFTFYHADGSPQEGVIWQQYYSLTFYVLDMENQMARMSLLNLG